MTTILDTPAATTNAADVDLAGALRALARLLDMNPDAPRPGYVTLCPTTRPDGIVTGGFQFGVGRTPRENVAAVAAWAALFDIPEPEPFGTGVDARVDAVELRIYHPAYTDAELADCPCTEHCTRHSA